MAAIINSGFGFLVVDSDPNSVPAIIPNVGEDSEMAWLPVTNQIWHWDRTTSAWLLFDVTNTNYANDDLIADDNRAHNWSTFNQAETWTTGTHTRDYINGTAILAMSEASTGFSSTASNGANITTIFNNPTNAQLNATDGANTVQIALNSAGINFLFTGTNDFKIDSVVGAQGYYVGSNTAGNAPSWQKPPSAYNQDNTGNDVPAILVDPVLANVLPATTEFVSGDVVFQEYDNGTILSTFDGTNWANRALDTTFANTNLTADANRTHNWDGNTFFMTNAESIRFNAAATATSFFQAVGTDYVELSTSTAGEIRLVTPNIGLATATVGQVPTLVNATTGEVEYADAAALTAAEGITIDGTVIELGDELQNDAASAFTSDRYINMDAFNLELESSLDNAYPTTRFESLGDVWFGADSAASASAGADGRFFYFDKDKGAFMGGQATVAGTITGLGIVATSFGSGNVASNTGSVALGVALTSSGIASQAGGWSGVASADYSGSLSGLLNTSTTEYSVIAGGQSNDITVGTHSVIGGGNNNTIQNNQSFIGGGLNNLSLGATSVIVGGQGNTINPTSGTHQLIGGGLGNDITGTGNHAYNIIVGGANNLLDGSGTANYQTIVGGQLNSITGTGENESSFIGGGNGNTISDIDKATTNASVFIGAGNANTITGINGWQSVIVGGNSNTINGTPQSSIVGGDNNSILSTTANTVCNFISSGEFNVLDVTVGFNSGAGTNIVGYSSIIGGFMNNNNSSYSVVLGGQNNVTNAANSYVAGINLESYTAHQTVIGSFNKVKTTNDSNQFQLQDDLFSIGNGNSSGGNQSTCFTVQKNGWTNINTISENFVVSRDLTEAEITPLAAFHLNTVNTDTNTASSGALLAPMTTVQRGTISAGNLINGLLVYDTDLNRYCYYNGTAWDCGEVTTYVATFPITGVGVDNGSTFKGVDGALYYKSDTGNVTQIAAP